MDVTLEITLLKLHHNNAIHLSFEHVQGTDMKIKYSSESIEKTRLLKFYLKALSLSPSHYYLIHHFISNLNIHIITYGLGIEHPAMTCTTVYKHLVASEAPEHFKPQPSNLSSKAYH